MFPSRNKEGDNIFAPRTDNIIAKGRRIQPLKRLSDFVPSSKLGLSGRIAQRVAPQYLDNVIRDEMGPHISTMADRIIRWNNAKETAKKNAAAALKTKKRKIIENNGQNLKRSLSNIIKQQSQDYGGKRKTKKSKKAKKSKKSKKSKRKM